MSASSDPISQLALLLATVACTLACKPDAGPARDSPTDSGATPVAADPDPGHDSGPKPGADQDAIKAGAEHARALTERFSADLKATLLTAIEADGPAHAIDVCKHDAPLIAAKHAGDGWTLNRTAARVRNPKNAPTPWQQAVLDRWQTQLDSGQVQDPATLEWREVVEAQGGPQLRYMRAIPMGGLCLACHGPADQLDPQVTAALAEHYPKDQATGFAVGELRGAFVVTGPLASR